MIAAIEINEMWIAVPSGVAGIAFLLYALWPSGTDRRIALCCGSFLIVVAAFAYVVADAPTVAPRPSPNVPRPVVVTPVAGGLADLVPKEERGKIGRFYLSLADVVSQAENLKTTEDLRAAYISAGRLMKTACDLPAGLAPFTEAANKLFSSTISLESQPVTPAVRDKFTSACRQIAAELGVTQ